MNNWYFSISNGLDFSSGTPVAASGGQVTAMEDGSAINDTNGHLLFYTDSMNVWNKQHAPMPNGSGSQGGHQRSTQAALVVQKPGSESNLHEPKFCMCNV